MPTPEELEDAAAAEAVAGLRRRLEEFGRKATATQARMQPDGWAWIRTTLAAELRSLDTSDLTGPIQEAAGRAVEEGVTDARTRLRVQTPRRRVMAPMDVIRAVMRVPDQAAEELDKAARLLEQATTPDDLQDALARARGAVSRTERTARWAVNRSLSEGTRSVTEEQGTGRLWIPERDACLRCLAYAGLYVGPGQEFPGGLTYGTPGTRQLDPVPDPPLHPNCRCRTIPWREEWGSDYPDSLKREAQRSVLRGWSLPSESERARIQAADRLLNRTALPKSVQDYAARAVRKGEFPRGRDFPRAGRSTDLELNPKRGRDQQQAARDRDRDPLAGLNRKEARSEPDRPQGPTAGEDIVGRLFAQAGLQMPTTPVRERTALDIERDERAEDIKVTNPRFDFGREYQVNCQRVAVAYELRRRGYDVEALPNRKEAGDKQYRLPDLEDVWRTPTGGKRSFTEIKRPGADVLKAKGYPATFTGQFAYRNDQVRAKVASWPPGARGWVVANWQAGGAHIWNVEIGSNGEVIWLDAQPGRQLDKDGAAHLDRARDVWIMRVDDLVPAEEQVRMVKNRQR